MFLSVHRYLHCVHSYLYLPGILGVQRKFKTSSYLSSFLEQEPCRGSVTFVVESIAARNESQMGYDMFKICLNKPGPRVLRIWLAESVHEPESICDQDLVHLI